MGFIQPVSKFREGFRGDLDINDMPIGAASAVSNLLFDRGSLRVRQGIKRQYQVSGGSYGVQAFTEYYNRNAPINYRLLAVLNNQMLLSGDASNPATAFSSPTTLTTTLDPTAIVRFAQFEQWMFFVAPTATLGTQLLTDIGFESGTLAAWDPSASGAANQSTHVHSGTHAAQLTTNAGTGVLASIAQTLTVTPGEVVNLSFWTANDGSHDGRYSILDNTNNQPVVSLAPTGVLGTTFQHVTVPPITVPVNCYSLIVVFASPYAAAAVAYFDDVSLTTVNPANKVQVCFTNPLSLTQVQAIDAADRTLAFPSSGSTIGAGGTLPAGTYLVGVSYARLALDGTTYVEGPLTLAQVAGNQWPGTVLANQKFTFTVTEPSDSQASDVIYVYLADIGLYNATQPLDNLFPLLYRVQLIACQGNGATDTITISAPATGLEYTYTPTVMRPPAGITTLCAFSGRMYYALGDSLYISNANAPDVVPQLFTANTTPNIGGYVPIGTDGGVITALLPFGSSLMIFKERGIWRAVGDPGSPDFIVEQIASERGALSQEGVTVAIGNLLLWTETNSIWAWDGTHFFEIGAPIAAQWKTQSNQARCPLVYDPTLRQVLLIQFGSTSLGAPAWVCDVTEPIGTLDEDPTTPLYSWTQYAGMPCVAARVLTYAPTPGLYASDYGASSGGKTGIFQLNSAQTTDDAYETSGIAIAYSWTSGMLYGTPDGHGAQTYKNLTGFSALMASAVPLTGVNLHLLLDGSTSPAAVRANVTNITHNGQYRWYPAPMAACLGYQLNLFGTSTTGGELLSLEFTGTKRGTVR